MYAFFYPLGVSSNILLQEGSEAANVGQVGVDGRLGGAACSTSRWTPTDHSQQELAPTQVPHEGASRVTMART